MKPIEEVIKILKRRAYINMCSYQTAWKQYMTKEEKEGYQYLQVLHVMFPNIHKEGK